MSNREMVIVLCYGVFAMLTLGKSIWEVIKKKNPFGLTIWFSWMGIFVWGDGVIIGAFWVIASIISLYLSNFNLFMLIVAIFWVVRSMGEMIYWLNQQFSTVVRNEPKTLIGFSWFPNDSIWFVYQIIWQCVMVVAIIATILISRI